MNILLRFPTVLLFIMAAYFTLTAQSTASRLDVFKKVLDVQIGGSGYRSISGVTFEPSAKTLYVVDDNGLVLFEIASDGSTLREITLQGFEDVEGIAFQSGRHFLIVEERRANIIRVEIPSEGTGPVKRSSGELLSIADTLGNTGVEGVAWCGSQGTAYAVTEMNPKTLYRIECDDAGVPVNAYADDPFHIEDMPDDAAGLFVCSDGTFIICNQVENRLIGYNAQGERLSELSLGMTQPEGVTIDEAAGVMYVVGEPGQLCVFEVDKTANSRITDAVMKITDGISGDIPAISSEEIFFTLQGRRIAINKKNLSGRFPGFQTLAPGIYCTGMKIKSVRYAGF